MSVVFETPLDLKLSSRERLCEIYAEKLHALKPNHELLRYFTLPKTGEEWRAIRKEFFLRFGDVNFPGDNSVGAHALSYFYGKFSLALQKACLEAGIEVK